MSGKKTTYDYAADVDRQIAESKAEDAKKEAAIREFNEEVRKNAAMAAYLKEQLYGSKNQ